MRRWATRADGIGACGLGSTGRMLHPDEGMAFTRALLVSQSSKLMLELVVGWSRARRAGRAPKVAEAK